MTTNIERKRGDTYADEFTLTSKTTGLAINITGYTFLLTLDPSAAPVDNTNNVYALVGTILDGPGGRVEFAPSAGQADQLGTFYYDIQMIDGASRKRTIESGKYKYVQDITKV